MSYFSVESNNHSTLYFKSKAGAQNQILKNLLFDLNYSGLNTKEKYQIIEYVVKAGVIGYSFKNCCENFVCNSYEHFPNGGSVIPKVIYD